VQFNPKEHGQGLAEYAFLIMLVALVVIILLALFGEAVRDMYLSVIAEI
jgi:pilus assembly protein Flp/PilA